jgi:hypothetical protein
MSCPVSALWVQHRQDLGQIEGVALSKLEINIANLKDQLVELTKSE